MKEKEITKPLSLQEIHKVLLEILVSIDKCCRENNIEYSLSYGTLLGAVRHKGFIPWDDDIDLMMTRDNLNRFISHYKDNKYVLISNDTKDWGWQYVSICDKTTIVKYEYSYENATEHGLWVSIFPFDNMPEHEKQWKCQKSKINFWFSACKLKRSKWVHTGFLRNVVKLIMRLLLSPFPLVYLAKKQEKYMTIFNNDNTKNMFQLVLLYHIYPVTLMQSFVDLEFEGINFMAIEEYDLFLRQEYGDYMTMPSKENQKPQHDYTVYRKLI